MKKILIAMTACLFAGFPAIASAGEIWLTLDQVRNYSLKSPVSNVVVGNSEIADVTVGQDEKLFLHGKKTGVTNIFFYDKEGNQLENLTVRVRQNPSNTVTLHLGTDAKRYSCTDVCDELPKIEAQ